MAYNFAASSSQYLLASSMPSFSGTPATVSVWATFATGTSAAVRTPISVQTTSTTDDARIHIRALTAGALDFLYVAFGGQTQVTTADAYIVAGDWYHLCAVTTSNTSRSFYINGTSIGTNTTSLTSHGSYSRTYIGSRYSVSLGVGTYHDGNLAEAAVWNTNLNASEIASLAKGMPASLIKPQNLRLYTPLVREILDIKAGTSITSYNTPTVSTHPRIYG